jgi:hypothetical protein
MKRVALQLRGHLCELFRKFLLECGGVGISMARTRGGVSCDEGGGCSAGGGGGERDGGGDESSGRR